MNKRDGAGIARVPLQALRFHPRNVRSNLGDLTELSESIRHEGVLVPLMAERRAGGGLRLLHGHRRWAAADIAGLKTVPVVIVREHTDDEAIMLMLAEDKKEAISTADRAKAVRALHREFDYSWETIAERLGVSEETVLAWRDGQDPVVVGVRRAAVNRVREPVLQKPPRRAPRRPRAPHVKPKQLHTLIERWSESGPPELIAELRELLGGWAPVEEGAPVVVPDLAVVDEIEVELVLNGARSAHQATSAAVCRAIQLLDQQGLSAKQVGDRLGLSGRQIVRWRSAMRETGAA